MDRLSNPRPPFHVARCVNTVVFGGSESARFVPLETNLPDLAPEIRAIGNDMRELWLIPGEAIAEAPSILAGRPGSSALTTAVDLTTGLEVEIRSDDFGVGNAVSRESLVLVACKCDKVGVAVG